MNLDSPIRELYGVGEKTEKLYNKTGVYTVSDILLNFPRGYKKLPEISSLNKLLDSSFQIEDDIAILGTLKAKPVNRRGKNKDITVATVTNSDGAFEAVWFNAPYMRSNLNTGVLYVFMGSAKREGKKLKISMPRVYTKEDYEEKKKVLFSTYHLTKGLKNASVQKAVLNALSLSSDISDYLPEPLIKENSLYPLNDAIKSIHFPKDFDDLKCARDRLCYDEFFRFFYFMQRDKKTDIREENTFSLEKKDEYERVLKSLPFSLTNGQKEALNEILSDFYGPYIEERMLQGDVGCGKTLVSFLAMLLFVSNGYKASIMAPTEVLARQHENTFKEYMESFDLPYRVYCLTGSTKGEERKEIKKALLSDEPLFLIGTHAIIQKGINIKSLGLSITDEQHRFGVKQRKLMAEKGDLKKPFTIVMSATPIPRSLAMVLYGNMNLSVIKELPKERLPIKNAVIKKNKRRSAFKFIEKELKAGHQAYIICPLIESSEKTESESVTLYKDVLNEYFEDAYPIGIMHGRLKDSEKNLVMESFLKGESKILLSTTVVEVGVNVKNATVIMIENAEKFGLSQLHQLRGRVGRGKYQSYAIFIDSSDSEKENERLSVISSSNDGFFVASSDLKMRGPGDFFGIRQSGTLSFSLADIYQDSSIMKKASEDVKNLFKNNDPCLSSNEFKSYMEMFSRVIYTNL